MEVNLLDDLILISRESPTPSVVSVKDDEEEQDTAVAIGDVSPKPLELTIASLDLGKNDEDFADGIACVQAYWGQASQMDADMQEKMRQLIISKQFAHTVSSRQGISVHRLYRAALRKDEMNTWPVFLILKAIYKEIPQLYMQRVRAKGLAVETSDHTNDYMAAYPDTIRPRIFDTDTKKGREYRELWPKLKNTPTIYRKLRDKNHKQPTATVSQPSASSSSKTPSLRSTATGTDVSNVLITQQPEGRGKKRPATEAEIETPTKRLSTQGGDFEFDKALERMTLPGVPSKSPAKVDVEKELANLKREFDKTRQQMHMFIKVTADVVTSLKTEIEDLKEEIKVLKK